MAKLLIGAGALALLLAPDALAQRAVQGPDRTARMFERFDKNKDGNLTKDEVGDDRMWSRLSAADKDKDGNVTKEEMASLPAGRGRSNAGAFEFLAKKYDADKNGSISTEEYGRDAKTFARLDRNQDGVLSAADWQVDDVSTRRRGGNSQRGDNRAQAAAPRVGDPAPDFDLTLVVDAKQRVKLSSFTGDRPVALIFGSCT